MQILPQNNTINFTSTPIQPIILKEMKDGIEVGTVKAMLTRLDPWTSEDKTAIEQIQKKWKDKQKLLDIIKKNFSKKNGSDEFYAIEKPESETLAEKIVGLLGVKIMQNEFQNQLYLSAIMTKPKLSSRASNGSLKGIGETLFRQCFVSAKTNHANRVNFVSYDDKFYTNTLKNAGVDLSDPKKYNPKENKFFIPKEDYDKYITSIDKKYK